MAALKAMAGTPARDAVVAAPTVPEPRVARPRLSTQKRIMHLK